MRQLVELRSESGPPDFQGSVGIISLSFVESRENIFLGSIDGQSGIYALTP